jgi:hypothetical protein
MTEKNSKLQTIEEVVARMQRQIQTMRIIYGASIMIIAFVLGVLIWNALPDIIAPNITTSYDSSANINQVYSGMKISSTTPAIKK